MRKIILAIVYMTICPMLFAQQAPNNNYATTAAPSATQSKVTIYIFKPAKMAGAADYWYLFVNGNYAGTLRNATYTKSEVAPGTVVISSKFNTVAANTPAGAVIFSGFHSSNSAMHRAKLENITLSASAATEMTRFQSEAGKTYYFRMDVHAVGFKIVQLDQAAGEKELRSIHISPQDQ